MNDISRMSFINISEEDKAEAGVLNIAKYTSEGGINHDGI